MKLAALLIVGLLSSVAAADDGAPPPPQQRQARLRELIVERFDRDGDGRLDPRERRQAARALRRMANRLGKRGANRRAKLIQKYDLDGDGNLGPGELPPRVQKRLRRMDRNQDGWLDQNDQR